MTYSTYYLRLIPLAGVREVAALSVIGHFDAADIPQLCEAWLADGRASGSSEMARIASDCAGGASLEGAFEVALAQLGAPVLEFEEAAAAVAQGFARAIADGEVSLLDGNHYFLDRLDEGVLPWPEPIHVARECWSGQPVPDGLPALLFDIMEASHRIADNGVSPHREEALRRAYSRLAYWPAEGEPELAPREPSGR